MFEVCSSLSEMEELRSTDQICTNGTTRKLQMVIKEISLYECLSKIAWEPITLAEEATEDQACSSKFNGKGWLRTQDPEAENNETWPMCENCNEALSLLLQLVRAHGAHATYAACDACAACAAFAAYAVYAAYAVCAAYTVHAA